MVVRGALAVLLLLLVPDLSHGQVLSKQVQERYCELIGEPIDVESVKFHIIKDSRTPIRKGSYNHVSTNLPCLVGRNVVEFTFQKVTELPKYLQERLDSNSHNVVFLQSETGTRYLSYFYSEKYFEQHVTADVSFLEMLLLENEDMKPSYHTQPLSNVGEIHILLYTAPTFYHGLKHLLTKALPARIGDRYRQFNASQIEPFRKDLNSPADLTLGAARVVSGLFLTTVVCILASFCICTYPLYLFAQLDEDFQNRHEPDEVPADFSEDGREQQDWDGIACDEELLLQTAIYEDDLMTQWTNEVTDLTQRTVSLMSPISHCTERDLEGGTPPHNVDKGKKLTEP